MKLFYKTDSIIWKNLFSYIDESLGTVCEMILPSMWESDRATGCQNVIRLWDEAKYGKKFCRPIVCGEDHRGDDLYDHDSKDHLYKIDDAIGDEEVVVLALSDNRISNQLLEYFLKIKKQKKFSLHVFMNLDVMLRDKSERYLLRYVDFISKMDSIAFFNHGDLPEEDEDDMEIEEWVEMIRTRESILAEEAGRVWPLIKQLHPLGEKELWLYNSSKRKYEAIQIQDDDLKHNVPKQESTRFEVISPNEGRATCARLKEYRSQFKLKHGLRKREQPCTYVGECQGSCVRCEQYAEGLWEEAYRDKKGVLYGESAKINGIIRLRENIDGPGIRTLIVMNDCHLQCKYCINEEYINLLPTKNMKYVYELSQIIMKDAVYFEETGGGVTFGGGEPLLNPEFILSFKEKNPRISIAVETSLNVPFETVASLVNVVDYWIVDIKDMNDDIYMAYTGLSNWLVVKNLKYLIHNVAVDKIRCRVPWIANYNTETDVQQSVAQLEEMGLTEVECFEYRVGK